MAVLTVAQQPAQPPEHLNALPHALEAPKPGAAGRVRRTELGTFLRSRRERLAPEDVGLPAGQRRRTPGLRREEVAALAGVGVTWYTWLEQGRPINASTQVLDSLARTLRLDQDEHNHLYRLADVPSLAPTGAGGCDLESDIQSVLDEISSIACVVNERFDLLAWNRTYALVFPGVVDYRGKYRNTLWNIFTMPGCCHPFVNRAEEMPRMVATFRGAYAHHVGEPAWEQFIKELLEASPPFAELWAQHEVGGYGTRFKIFTHPAVGRLTFKSLSLGIHASPGARMVVYTAVDEATTQAMRNLENGMAICEKKVLPCGHRFQGMVADSPVPPVSPVSPA
jgi:transcriptional regulator with XRE-family HTH domain